MSKRKRGLWISLAVIAGMCVGFYTGRLESREGRPDAIRAYLDERYEVLKNAPKVKAVLRASNPCQVEMLQEAIAEIDYYASEAAWSEALSALEACQQNNMHGVDCCGE